MVAHIAANIDAVFGEKFLHARRYIPIMNDRKPRALRKRLVKPTIDHRVEVGAVGPRPRPDFISQRDAPQTVRRDELVQSRDGSQKRAEAPLPCPP